VPGRPPATTLRAPSRQLLHYRIQQSLIGKHLVQAPQRRLDEILD
jgi:hypothetical protein